MSSSEDDTPLVKMNGRSSGKSPSVVIALKRALLPSLRL
jgi:hypothetical protein